VWATILVGILTTAATIIGAVIANPGIFDAPVPPSPIPTPACITADDILVRLHFWKGRERIDTLAPSQEIPLAPNLTVDLQVEFRSVTGTPLPALECAWENANTANTNSATEGVLLHRVGCNVDYRSGHTKITDTLSLQVSQPSCPALPLYAFFISE
jgi:hypothetical protein